MSVATEIERLQTAKINLKTSLNAKNDSSHQITDELIDEYSDFVDSIQTGSGGSDINFYVQNAEPDSKDGIWIKSNKEYNKLYVGNEKIVDNWITDNTTLLYTVQENATVSIGNYIYYFGGGISSSATNRAYKFDTINKTFTVLTNLPYLAFGICATVYNNNIYIFGGRSGSTVYNYAYKYDVSNDSYTALATMPEPVAQMGVAIKDSKIYIVAGTASGGSTRKKTLFEYNILTDTWQTLTPMPQARNCPAVQIVDDNIYVFGGFDGSVFNTAYKYNITADSWTQIENVPYAAYGIGSVQVNDFIYLLGGRMSSGASNSCYLYDVTSGKYLFINNLQNQMSRIQCSCVLINNTIYIVGGEIIKGTSSASQSNIIQYSKVGLTNRFEDGSIFMIAGSNKTKFIDDVSILVGNAYETSDVSGIVKLNNCYYGNGTSWNLL